MVNNNSDFSEDIVTPWRWSKTEKCRSLFRWFLINFNLWRWSRACVGIDNWVILLRARYKYNNTIKSHITISWLQSVTVFIFSRPLSVLYSILNSVHRLINAFHTRIISCVCRKNYSVGVKYQSPVCMWFNWSGVGLLA